MFGAELTSLFEIGASIVVGTVDPDGEPRATRAWSADVIDLAAGRIRFTMTADDEVSIANLATGRVSLTAADVRTFRAVQVKGLVAAVRPPTADDLATMRTRIDRFLQAVHETDGNPIEGLRRMLPHHVLAIEIDVDEIFDQTPGPGAGAALGRTKP